MKLKLLKALNVTAFAISAPVCFLSSCSNNKPEDVQKVTVTLDPNGGSISKTKYEIEKGTTFSSSLFEKPTKTDCTFNKWVMSDGSDIPDQYKIESDVTFKATYTQTPTPVAYVTVTLNANGGTISSNKVNVEKDTSFSSNLFPKPTRTGYTFNRWTFNDDTEIPSSYKISSNITLKAQWDNVPAEYVTVTLNANGGTPSSWTQDVEKGTVYYLNLFTKPTRSGYTFTKWTFSDDSDIPSNYKIESNITFKAQWTEIIDPDQKYIDDLNIQSVCDNGYLFEGTFTDYSLNSADIYSQWLGGACSAFYKNGYVGRNFEFYYNNNPEMVIHTTNNGSRYASVGVALCNGLTPSTIKSKSYISSIKNIPWYTVDGINEYGLCVSINEVPLDENNQKNDGDGSKHTKITELQLVRYLLDYAKDIDDAKEVIKNVNVVGMSNYTNELHLMLADANGKCAEIEFVPTTNGINKEPKFYTSKDSSFENIITNFGLYKYDGDCTKNNWNKSTSSLSTKAEGCERYILLYDKLITNGFTPTSFQDVLDVMALVNYSQAYSIPCTKYSDEFWFSEFNYISSYTKTTEHTVENYKSIVDGYYFNKELWDNKQYPRTGNHGIWVTKNSSAYDIANKQLKLVFEEKYPISKVFKIDRSQE